MPIAKYVIERQDLSVKGGLHFMPVFFRLTLDHKLDARLNSIGGWHPVGESPFDQPLSFKCEGLINKKEYKFRVVAVNKMGNSEPGVFPKVVLAKDPWGKILSFLCFHIDYDLLYFFLLRRTWETR